MHQQTPKIGAARHQNQHRPIRHPRRAPSSSSLAVEGADRQPPWFPSSWELMQLDGITGTVVARLSSRRDQPLAEVHPASANGSITGGSLAGSGSSEGQQQFQSRRRRPAGTSLQQDASSLFEAVESDDAAAINELLTRRPNLASCTNELQLCPLDLAMLLDHRAAAGALQSSMGRSSSDPTPGSHPRLLLDGMERHLARLADVDGNETAASLLACLRLLEPPNPPSSIRVEAISADAVQVTLLADAASGPVAALFRLEWRQLNASSAGWNSLELTVRQPEVSCSIRGLHTGQPVSVRAAAFGLAGWSRLASADLGDVVPSAWWQLDAAAGAPGGPLPSPSTTEVTQLKSSLADEVATWLTEQGVHDGVGSDPHGNKHAKSHLRPARLRRVFASFTSLADHKLARRPKPDRLYLTAAVFLHAGERDASSNASEKVLTRDEVLPHAEVGSDLPGAQNELAWLSRLLTDSPCFGAVLDQLERLICDDKDGDQTTLPPQLLTRMAILRAGRALQTALGGLKCSGAGHLQLAAFPRLLTATGRHIVLVGRVSADDDEAAAALAASGCRWVPLSLSGVACGQLLAGRLLADAVAFSARSQTPLEPGLYLSCLRLRGTCDLISLEVDARQPNSLPCVRIRQNSHVSAEEMRLLRCLDGKPPASPSTPALMKLVRQLVEAAESLSSHLKLSAEQRSGLRIFTGRVIQPCARVALLLLLPAPEETAVFTASSDDANASSMLPVSAFDQLQGLTYSSSWFPDVSAALANLDLLVGAAQLSVRRALTQREATVAKNRLARLQSLHAQAETMTRSARWAADAIAEARRADRGCILFNSLLKAGSTPPPQPLLPLQAAPPAESASRTVCIQFDHLTLSLSLNQSTRARDVCRLALEAVAGSQTMTLPPASAYELVVATEDGVERPLPPDFRPLLLQAPWNSGLLAVRLTAPKADSADSGVHELH